MKTVTRCSLTPSICGFSPGASFELMTVKLQTNNRSVSIGLAVFIKWSNLFVCVMERTAAQHIHGIPRPDRTTLRIPSTIKLRWYPLPFFSFRSFELTIVLNISTWSCCCWVTQDYCNIRAMNDAGLKLLEHFTEAKHHHYHLAVHDIKMRRGTTYSCNNLLCDVRLHEYKNEYQECRDAGGEEHPPWKRMITRSDRRHQPATLGCVRGGNTLRHIQFLKNKTRS